MMKKYTIALLVCLQAVGMFGQNPEIKAELPTVIPPSPTVAALMRFEEVPVSNYTGVPDVSIPLFSTTGNHGMNLNIALSYHPSSVKKEEIAGFTGLGWSLMAGGTISRTVRDMPDDIYEQAGQFSAKKIGIYHNDGSFAPDNNNYYSVLPLLNPNYLIDDTNAEINRFFFEVNEKQKFDAKHDLYQFNFMGYSGRFIIEKKQNGTYEVVKLDKNNLVINYNATNKTFEVKDTKGFRYVFDVKELSDSNSFNLSKRIDNETSENYSVNYQSVISAFHLSKVFYNDELIVEFIFNNNTLNESQVIRNWTFNMPLDPTLQQLLDAAHSEQNPENYTKGVLPLEVNQNTTVTTKTKKITQIRVVGKAIIDFEIGTGGRNDVNLPSGNLHPYLKGITVKDWKSNVVKEYHLNYLFGHKLFLDNIQEGLGQSQLLKNQFRYEGLDLDYNDFSTDYWGYYKQIEYGPDCSSYVNMHRDTDKVNCKKDVLKQIIHPTKGSVIFQYEPNTYSYEGDNGDTDEFGNPQNFDQNPDNYTISGYDNFTFNNNPNQGTGYLTHNLGDFATGKTLIFTTSLTGTNEQNLGFLFLKITNLATNAIESKGMHTGGCPLEMYLEGGYRYEITFSWATSPPRNVTAVVDIKEKTRNSTTNKWLYGGGIRIKNIYYTDKESPELATQEYPDTFSKKVSYAYHFFDDASRSSGSLVFPKPKMEYEAKRIFNIMATSTNFSHTPLTDNVFYKIYSKSNNLSFISTQGADVGYKNVTVTETGNGRTELIYTSPIDYPEFLRSTNVAYPYAPSANIDYKRGLLKEERKYDSTSRILTEKQNEYAFVDETKITGVTTFYKDDDCPYAGMYADYAAYQSGVLDSGTYQCGYYNGMPVICGSQQAWNARRCGPNTSDFVSYYLNEEAFGWTKLTGTTSKEYFYEGGNTSIVQKTASFAYNTNNRQISSEITTVSNGNAIEKKYFYPQDTQMAGEPFKSELVANNMIETPLSVEEFRGSNKRSTQKVIYKKWGADILAPEIVQAAKGVHPLETVIKYNSYDEFGNPLEVQQENGIRIAYIWGYNKTQPIAKIENAAYADVQSQVSNLQGLSDTGTEANLITALNSLRSSLPNAMVTTYTYKPLIGLSTMTDSKGFKTTYEYDTFNRLFQVKDQDGNVLNKNEYNYRPN